MDDWMLRAAVALVLAALGAIAVVYRLGRDARNGGGRNSRGFDRVLDTITASTAANVRLTEVIRDLSLGLQRHEDRQVKMLDDIGARLERAIATGIETAFLKLRVLESGDRS